MASTKSSGPDWDADRARWLVGKHVLVGVTHLAADGKSIANQEQFHGMVMTAVEGRGIEIACLGGAHESETVMLPPVTAPFLNAKPGKYTLRATGEVITNPDATASWTIHHQPKK